MAYNLDNKLVVCVTSSALFDLTREHEIFMSEGVEAFRKYQIANRQKLPSPGSAFPFIQRLLHLNVVFPEQKPVEVIILSRNDPEAGCRIIDAASEYGLDISRTFFLSGKDPYPYMPAVNAVLYLSANKNEVRDAVAKGHPAGYVLPCGSACAADDDKQLRVAFDFDGVLVDDEAETQYADGGLPIFHYYEVENKERPLKHGPLMPLMKRLSAIQALEKQNAGRRNDPEKAIRIAIVTARNAPAHHRLINTLKHHGLEPDELFLTGV